MQSLNKQQKRKYFPEIDGLRALAVIAVVINHLSKDFLQSGYLGVDIFFVISGYVITSSLVRRKYRNFKEFISGFYLRRIRRILPSLAVYVIIITLLICLFNPHPSKFVTYAERALLGISNITFYRTSTDYFADSTLLNPFTHTWSLGVEEQFYFLYPLIFWFSGIWKGNLKGQKNLFNWITGFLLISFLGFISLYQINQPAAYFLMPLRFWELASGVLVYLLAQRNSFFLKFATNLSSEFILLLIFLIFFIPNSFAIFSTPAIVFLTSVLLISLSKSNIAKKFLSCNLMVSIGKLSYSLYLWHWGCFVIARWIMGDSLFALLVALMISILISILNYLTIEKFFIKQITNLKSFKFLIFVFSYFIGIIFPHQFFFLKKYKFPFYQNVFNYGSKISPWQNPYFPFSNKRSAKIDCENIIDLSSLYIHDDGTICSLINKNSKGRIFVIGDSHSANHVQSIIHALDQKAETNPFKSLIEIRINPLAARKRSLWTNIRENDEKKEWESTLNFFKNNLTNKDLVIFSTERDDVIKYKNKSLPRETDFYLLDKLEIQLNIFKNIILENKSVLIIVDDLPKPCKNSEYYLINVVKNGNFSYCKVSKKDSLIDRENLTNMYKRLSNGENVIYVDFHEVLCPKQNCNLTNPFDSKKLLYVDTSPHLYFESNKVLSDDWSFILDKYIIKKIPKLRNFKG